VKAALDLGIRKCSFVLIKWTFHNIALSANYPECLGKCHMVNVPFVFSSMWYFVKGLLDEM
jgi:hypothetical protein